MGRESAIVVACSVGHRRSSDPELLWLWCRPAATDPIRPLAWEPPYAMGAALENTKRQKKKKKDRAPFIQKQTHATIAFGYMTKVTL